MPALMLSYELGAPLDQLPAATPFETGADLLHLLKLTGELEQRGERHLRTVQWRVATASGTSASIKPVNEPDVAARAALSLVRGFGEAEERELLPQAWSITAGNRAERVASRLGETIGTGLQLHLVGDEAQQVVVTRQAARNLRAATKLNVTSFGSVIGTLGRVTVHNGRRAALWSDLDGGRIEVHFGEQHVEDMRGAWARQHVEITGMLWENAAGQVLRIDLDSLHMLDHRHLSVVETLPRGFYPEMTNGLSSSDYLRLVRGEG